MVRISTYRLVGGTNIPIIATPKVNHEQGRVVARKEAPVRGSEHLAGLGAGLLRESAATAPEWLAWGSLRWSPRTGWAVPSLS